MLFDSHAHYYDSRFSEEIPGGADTLLTTLFAGDVCGIVHVAEDLQTAQLCCEYAARYPQMYAAAGIHPGDITHGKGLDADMAALAALLEERKEKKIVALGEIGLDYHYPDTDKAGQSAYFHAQMKLAEQYGLPVIIHDREAHGDTMTVIREHPGVHGVMHSFSGSAEMARELVKRGWYISFSGVVTFKNAPKTREAASAVPPDRLLIETDCPYLAPEPHRGQINHSGYLSCIAAELAKLHGVSYEEMCRITTENALRFFKIEGKLS